MRISDWSSDVCSSDLAAAPPLIGGDDDAAVAIGDPSRQRLRRKAAEHHRMDRPEAGAGEHGEGGFGDHRQVERHPVPAPHASALQHIGEAAHLFMQLPRSEEHTSELQSLMRISYAVFCLKKKKKPNTKKH